MTSHLPDISGVLLELLDVLELVADVGLELLLETLELEPPLELLLDATLELELESPALELLDDFEELLLLSPALELLLNFIMSMSQPSLRPSLLLQYSKKYAMNSSEFFA